MTYTVNKYKQGVFCWADVVSSDLKATTQFLTAVMGWKAEEVSSSSYTMFSIDGKNVAGGMQLPEGMEGIPSHWNSYVCVDDIDAMVKKATDLGGTIFMPPTDVMTSGKMAGIIDPTGAPLMMWQAVDSIGAELVNTIGAMVWNELHTRDTEGAKKFYSQLFGWKINFIEEMQYNEIEVYGRRNGGMIEIQPEWGDVPSNWAVYFTVKNLDQSIEKVTSNGGQIMGEVISIPVGNFILVQEPAGAVFLLMEFKDETEHWEE